jgi:hypothetical protein
MGVTISGTSASVPLSAVVTTSWDGGATWNSVRGGSVSGVLGSVFVRDYIPALNTPVLYRAALSATSAANAVTDPYGTNSGEWLSYGGYGTGGAGTYAANQAATGPDGSATTAVKKAWTTAPTAWSNQGVDIRSTTGGAQWPVATSDGRVFTVWVYASTATSKTFQARVLWNNGGTFLGRTDGTATTVSPNTWTQVSVALPTTLPYPTATQFQLVVEVMGGTTFWTAGEYFLGTWAMLAPQDYTFPGYPPATVTSGSVTIASAQAWLQDPLAPKSAVPLYADMSNGHVKLTIRSLAGGVWGQHEDLASVIGSSLPAVSLSVRQKVASLPLSLMYVVAAEGGNLHGMLMGAGQVVLRGLPVSGLLDPVAHCSVGSANEVRYAAGTISEWLLTARQVQPVTMRIVVPWWTYDQVVALVVSQIGAGATYSQVLTAQPAGKTYTQWVANPGVAS